MGKKTKNFYSGVLLPVYQFLISLRLAVILILLLIVVLSVGTIIESLHGAPAAKILVYNSPLLTVLLVMLAANVLAVALSRLPWKKKHTGFVITHCGVLLILIGSLMTRYFMVDGQMAIQEGKTSGTLVSQEPLLEVHDSENDRNYVFDVTPKAFPWEGREKIKSRTPAPFDLYLLNFYPKARVEESLKETAAGPAALEAVLYNDMMNQHFWLVEGDPQAGSLNLGPACVVFSKELLSEKPEDASAAPMFLEFQVGEKHLRKDLPEKMKLPYSFDLEGTAYRVTIHHLFRNAIVVGRELAENENVSPDQWGNPAVQLVIEGENLNEAQTVFSKFPDFSTIHGHAEVASGIRVLFHLPHQKPAMSGHELRFVKTHDGKLKYQIANDKDVTTGDVEPGKDIETGWMDIQFRVEKYFRHAGASRRFEPRPNTTQANSAVPAVRVELVTGQAREAIWLAANQVEVASVGSRMYHLVFGDKEYPLGFLLRLKDFKKKTYPGTNKAASFESDVELIDAMRGVQRDVTISMNEPLQYRGYKIYQSAYREIPGQSDISVFSAGKDPGVPVNYAGAIVLVAGIITMILQRRSSKKREGVRR